MVFFIMLGLLAGCSSVHKKIVIDEPEYGFDSYFECLDGDTIHLLRNTFNRQPSEKEKTREMRNGALEEGFDPEKCKEVDASQIAKTP